MLSHLQQPVFIFLRGNRTMTWRKGFQTNQIFQALMHWKTFSHALLMPMVSHSCSAKCCNNWCCAFIWSPRLLLISPIAKPFDYWVLVLISGCVTCLVHESYLREPLAWAFLIVLLFSTHESNLLFSVDKDQLRISPWKDKNKRIRHLCLKKKKIICAAAE